MPDISMCKHTTCPMRETCYRNSASGTEPNPHRQSYGGFAPDENGECYMYWPLSQPSFGKGGGQYRTHSVTAESAASYPR